MFVGCLALVARLGEIVSRDASTSKAAVVRVASTPAPIGLFRLGGSWVVIGGLYNMVTLLTTPLTTLTPKPYRTLNGTLNP